MIESVIDPGVVVRPPAPGRTYFAFADPSGGSGDSFAVAIAHMECDTAVLDLLHERKSPFDPNDVTAEVVEILRNYGVFAITGDRSPRSGW